MIVLIALALLILCAIGIVVYCCAAIVRPWGREADDDAQMEFLRHYRDGK